VRNVKRLTLLSKSPEQTQMIGEALGRLAQPGDLYLLVGELGAGKTSLVQGLARGLGVEETVKSPSFTLINEYRGRIPLYHADLYRISNAEDVITLGLDDYIFFGEGVTAVEWAHQALDVWPEERLTLFLSYVADQVRQIECEAIGERYEELLRDLGKRLEILEEA